VDYGAVKTERLRLEAIMRVARDDRSRLKSRARYARRFLAADRLWMSCWALEAVRGELVRRLLGSEELLDAARLVVEQEIAAVDADLRASCPGIRGEIERARGLDLPPKSGGVGHLIGLMSEVRHERPGHRRGDPNDPNGQPSADRWFVRMLEILDRVRWEASEWMCIEEPRWESVSKGSVRLGPITASSWHAAVLALAHRFADGVYEAAGMC
jgi:hypothetical protein